MQITFIVTSDVCALDPNFSEFILIVLTLSVIDTLLLNRSGNVEGDISVNPNS